MHILLKKILLDNKLQAMPSVACVVLITEKDIRTQGYSLHAFSHDESM